MYGGLVDLNDLGKQNKTTSPNQMMNNNNSMGGFGTFGGLQMGGINN